MKRVYYLSGLPKTGKTTIVNLINDNNLIKDNNIYTVPEFLDSIPEYVYTTNSTYKTQEWIFKQFVRRNELIMSFDEGIILCDRSPLDPIAFMKASQNIDLMETMMFMMNQVKWYSGEVILLESDTKHLHDRLTDSGEKVESHFIEVLNLCFRNLFTNKAINIFNSEQRQSALIDSFYVYGIINQAIYQPLDLNSQILEIEKLEIEKYV